MKKLLNLLGIFVLITLMPSCNKDDGQGGLINPVMDVKATPFYGSVILSWKNPTDKDIYYTLVSYVNSKGEKVYKKFSRDDADPTTGLMQGSIAGFSDQKSYTFTLTAYGFSGQASKPVTVSAVPLEPAYNIVAKTVDVTSTLGGVIVSWTNTPKSQLYITISYQDEAGTVKKQDINALNSGNSYIIVSNVNKITLTVKDIVNNCSEEKSFSVSPVATKEISKANWLIADVDSYVGEGPSGNFIDGDLNTYWHSNYTSFPHWITVDMGKVYTITNITLARRHSANEDWNRGAPTLIKFQLSEDNETWVDSPEYSFDNCSSALQNFAMTKPIRARYFKLIALKPGNNNTVTHMAEAFAYGGD